MQIPINARMGVLFNYLSLIIVFYFKACMEIRVMQEHNHRPLAEASFSRVSF